MLSVTFGPWGLGFVWGALVATIVVWHRRLLDTVWILSSTAAVAVMAALVVGEPWTAAHVTGAAIVGWMVRRTLENIVERRPWM